ncbi:MAG: exosortase/archaeosortase family protein [Promethearchaeota archaeon]
MRLNEARSSRVLSLLKNRIKLFYLLALAPFPLVFYYTPLSIITPFYGFLLLLLKSKKLLQFEETNTVQKSLGLLVVVGSFFVYYLRALVYPAESFYTVANYAVYLLGLFLIFFEFSALKEAVAPLILIVAAPASALIAASLKPFLSPFADGFAHIIVHILRALGLDANVYLYNVPVIRFLSSSGRMISGAFVYECMGVYSALVFSIILAVILLEDPSGSKTKLAYSIVGFIGIFAFNILRVVIIFVADYLYGTEVGATVHYIIGYALFTAWLACFFYIYSKRQTLYRRIQSFWKRLF